MTEDEKLHLKACEFANNCRVELIENRKRQNMKPLAYDELQMIWLNHYDGFKAGYESCHKELENK